MHQLTVSDPEEPRVLELSDIAKIIQQYKMKTTVTFKPEVVDEILGPGMLRNLKKEQRIGMIKLATYDCLMAGAQIKSKNETWIVLRGELKVMCKGEFQTVQAGYSLPLNHLEKLSQLYKADAYVTADSPVDVLRFKNSEVSEFIFGPLKRTLISKVEMQAKMDVLYKSEKLEDNLGVNFYVMLVLAIVCKVKQFGYSETVVDKGEVPKGMHLIIEGEAQAIFDQNMPRETSPSEFCRPTITQPSEKPFKFGNTGKSI